jgi:hypothetical protein
MPCAPDLDVGQVQSMADALPAAMWPEWSQRLLPDLRPTTATRTTLSIATLLAGSRVKPAAAARLLDEIITPNAMNSRLWTLRSSAYWLSICAALIRLSDYLDAYGGAIDYRRRRHLNYSRLLSEHGWQQICEESGGFFQMTCTAVGPRCYLIEELSGTPALALRSLNGHLDERGLRALVNDFKRRLTADLELLLHDRAQCFLEFHGIDEPTAWHPPLDLLVDLDLPDLESP